jgi:hypothetical protein
VSSDDSERARSRRLALGLAVPVGGVRFSDVANRSGVGYKPARPGLDALFVRRVVEPWRRGVPTDGISVVVASSDRRVIRLQAMVVPAASLKCAMTGRNQTCCVVVDRLPVSTVLFYKYNMGEAVAVAVTIDSARVEPLVDEMQAFADEEILGHPTSIHDECGKP